MDEHAKWHTCKRRSQIIASPAPPPRMPMHSREVDRQSRTGLILFCLPWGRPGCNHAKRCMNLKTIQCLPNASRHVPIYLQQFPSYSNRKCKKSLFSCTAAHIFVSPGDAPAIITQYAALWKDN